MNKNIAIPIDLENIKLIFSKKFLIVILISVPSAIVADFLHIPLAWMLGPMIATSIAALSGSKNYYAKNYFKFYFNSFGTVYW